MADSNFILIACVVDKIQLKQNQNAESNAYHVALEQCLNALYLLLEEKTKPMY
jgi:hypothetical protein